MSAIEHVCAYNIGEKVGKEGKGMWDIIILGECSHYGASVSNIAYVHSRKPYTLL